MTCIGKHAICHVGTNVGQGCSELWKAELCRAELESGTFGERIFGALCVDAGCFSFRTTPRRHMGGSGEIHEKFPRTCLCLGVHTSISTSARHHKRRHAAQPREPECNEQMNE